MLINGTAGLYLHSVVSVFWKGAEHSRNAAIEEGLVGIKIKPISVVVFDL